MARNGDERAGAAAKGRPGVTRGSPPSASPQESPRSASWAELAWSLIGAYWIVVGIFVIPARLHEFKPARHGAFRFHAGRGGTLATTIGAAGAARARKSTQPWTHIAGVVLVLTWPIAWICLIVLGMNMR